jgi:hypothetical protein
MGQEQGLVRVNVAYARKQRLVQEHDLDGGPASAQRAGKRFGTDGKRVRPETLEPHVRTAGSQPEDSAKLPNIPKEKRGTSIREG